MASDPDGRCESNHQVDRGRCRVFRGFTWEVCLFRMSMIKVVDYSHGYYAVSIDGGPKSYRSGQGQEQFQVSLFASVNLTLGDHVAEFTNEPLYMQTSVGNPCESSLCPAARCEVGWDSSSEMGSRVDD